MSNQLFETRSERTERERREQQAAEQARANPKRTLVDKFDGDAAARVYASRAQQHREPRPA